MASGRPKSFDELEALERAMDVFWRRGYQAAGMADLLSAMGISRQSLYDTFGSKRGLFLRVLAHYRDTQLSQALALLERPGSRRENVKAVVGFFEELGRDPECRGCLVANSLVEFGPSEDSEIGELLSQTLSTLQEALKRALDEALETGELAPGKSSREISQALTNAVVGIAVTGRLQITPVDLSAVYAGTLSMLD